MVADIGIANFRKPHTTGKRFILEYRTLRKAYFDKGIQNTRVYSAETNTVKRLERRCCSRV